MQNMSLKCTAVKICNFKKTVDGRHLENQKIATAYADAERVTRAHRPSAILDFYN